MELRDDQTARDSRLLHALCCDVGFSQEAWERRLFQSDVDSTCRTYSALCWGGIKWKNLNCGSQSEGVGMDFLGSDKDILLVLEDTRVVEQDPVCPHNTEHSFKMIPTGHPAYVKLQFISAANRGGKQRLQTPTYCDIDEAGCFLLNGNRLKERIGPVGNAHIQGPAVKDHINDFSEIDNVIGLHCESWPASSAEWRHRPRPYNWPTPDSINEICSHGCELVAVGNPVSAASHLEWRLSSSLAEKTLIRSFTIYQIQCYFLLKMVLAFLIKPLAPHTLSSYHMKTVMLHVVETTDPAEWTETNLTRCFIKCLKKMHTFVLDGNCPQYFIPGHNLFEHRVQGGSRARVLRVVEELLSQGWKCVLQCPPFSNGNLSCRHPCPRCCCYTKHWERRRMEHSFKISYKCVTAIYTGPSNVMRTNPRTVVEAIVALVSVIRKPVERGNIYCPSERAASSMKLLMKGIIGYRLLAATTAIHANNQALLDHILEVAKRFLEESCDVDIASGRLKLATFLYLTGETDACVDTVHQFLARVTVNTVTFCGDQERIKRAFQQYGYSRKLEGLIEFVGLDPFMMLAEIAFPIAFSLFEARFSPAGIKYVFRNRPIVTQVDRVYQNAVFVDPLVYAFYLLVICHKDLGRLGKSRRCLELMSRIIRSPHLCCVFYPDVATLLLEYSVRYVIGECP